MHGNEHSVLLLSDAGNNIGNEGAKALGPHLAKLNNMATLNLSGACCDCLTTYLVLRGIMGSSTDNVVACARCQATT